jgi:hypothetical protein
MPIIFQPTQAIIETCDLVDQGIKTYLCSAKDDHLGRYESHVEALINITHCVRIIESIVDLARRDLVHIQSALILARSVFEGLLKVTWMLYPQDVFDCEARYIAQLNTEIDYLRRQKREAEQIGYSTENITAAMTPLITFSGEITAMLKERGYSVPNKIPDLRQILKSLKEERKYQLYILLCQYTHLSHYAGQIYRKHLGTMKELSQNEQLDKWQLVFGTCWPIFELATEFLLLRAQQQELVYSNEFKTSIKESIWNIANRLT